MTKKLYNHSYENGKIKIEEVVIEETAKMFKSKERGLLYYSSQIKKEQLNCLIQHFGTYMVSENPNAELFKQLIVQSEQRSVEIAENNLLRTKDALALAMSCELPKEV